MRDDYSDITVVLDRSGSMQSIADDTIGGFNTFVADQKKIPGAATFTLAQFDNEYDMVHEGKALSDVPPLDHQTFVPRGMTALLDAIGRTIVSTGARLAAIPEADRPGKVIFVIITDGHENASKEWTREKVFAEITKQRDVFKWEFVFLGANQNAINEAGKIGIGAGSSMTYAANAVGTRRSLQATSSNVGNYRTGKTTTANFTDDDRKKQQEAMKS